MPILCQRVPKLTACNKLAVRACDVYEPAVGVMRNKHVNNHSAMFYAFIHKSLPYIVTISSGTPLVVRVLVRPLVIPVIVVLFLVVQTFNCRTSGVKNFQVEGAGQRIFYNRLGRDFHLLEVRQASLDCNQ